MRPAKPKQSALGIRLANWRRQLEQEWHSVSFGNLQVETRDGQHHFQVEVFLGKVDPQVVQVELFAAEPDDRARAPTHDPGGEAAGPRGRLPLYRRSAGDEACG